MNSNTNTRRHGRDLHIRDNDLITGRDCRFIVQSALRLYDEDRIRAEQQAEKERIVAAEYARNQKWYRRALRYVRGR